MVSTLLNKRSHPLLPTFSVDSADAPSASSLPCSRDRGSSADTHALKLRHASSRVWSEIRGAIKAIGRSSRDASNDGSAAYEQSFEVESIQPFKGKAIALKKDSKQGSSSRKGKGIAPKELIRKLRLNNLGLTSNSTVVLRTPSLESGNPLTVLSSAHEILFNQSDSTPSTGESSKASVLPDESTRKTSVDSRFSILTKELTKRRHSRRHPWTRSSPEGGALGTIEESRVDRVQPTIETVEKASAAKVFLETHFNELINGPNMRALRRHNLEHHLYYSPHLTSDQKQAIRNAFCNQETWHLREQRVMASQSLLSCLGVSPNSYLDNYEPLKILGKGSFGVVRLVRERPAAEYTFSGQVYAMKVIRKVDMLRSSQEGHLRAKRDFLVASEMSTWVVPLIASFQDHLNLYLVMDYMPGGDFLGLLIRENILREDVARFYVAEMILAVEEAHRLRFIHRDIKPDNFLISASGHLKISDFGLAFDGHWSHDASYYSFHRYSMVSKLGINVVGDAQDRKDNKTIEPQVQWYQTLNRHEKDVSKGGELESILNWRNRYGNRTAANSVVGTSQYMAPEVVRGHRYDGRCD